jgi:hypothetical protein
MPLTDLQIDWLCLERGMEEEHKAAKKAQRK